MKSFRRRCPKVATSASFFELLSYFRKNQPLQAQAIQLTPDFQLRIEKKLGLPKHQVLTKEFVQRAQQEFHLQVHAWTINEPEEMNRVIAMGVDGIITDAPSRLLKILGRLQPA
jgi:glycerophosphoryl diester phosphodiesterase